MCRYSQMTLDVGRTWRVIHRCVEETKMSMVGRVRVVGLLALPSNAGLLAIVTIRRGSSRGGGKNRNTRIRSTTIHSFLPDDGEDTMVACRKQRRMQSHSSLPASCFFCLISSLHSRHKERILYITNIYFHFMPPSFILTLYIQR